MRFTFLAVAACLASAMRPEFSKIQSGVGSKIARLSDILSTITKTQDMATLEETTDAVSGILAEIEQPYRGALEHMSEENATTLRQLRDTFKFIIFGRIDECYKAAVISLNDSIAVFDECNVAIDFRQSPQGDLGKLEDSVSLKQIELNRLQGVVDVKSEINATSWGELNSHMFLIASPPACPGLPSRTMPALDVYFEESLYVIWFAAEQSAYVVVRDAWVLANANLQSAIEAYEIQLAVRNTQYCDWKIELEAACATFNVCYADANNAYTTLAQKVRVNETDWIRLKKSGDIIIHQLEFLLGEVEDQESPADNTSGYQIAFPAIPDAVVCDLTPLDADKWVPHVECVTYYEMDKGSCCCPEADRIATEEECATAQLTFRTGGPAEIGWSGTTGGIPGGCSWRTHDGTSSAGRGHWNSELVGGARDDMFPICRSVN